MNNTTRFYAVTDWPSAALMLSYLTAQLSCISSEQLSSCTCHAVLQDVLLSKSLRRRVVSLVINGDGNFEGYQFERQGVIEQVIGSSSEQYKAVVVQSKQPCTCHSLPGHVPTADPLVLRYGQSLFDRLGQQFEVAAADWRAYKEITGAIGIMLQVSNTPNSSHGISNTVRPLRNDHPLSHAC